MLGEGCSEEKGEHNSLPYVPSPCASPNFLSGLPALGGGCTCFSPKNNNTSNLDWSQPPAGHRLPCQR